MRVLNLAWLLIIGIALAAGAACGDDDDDTSGGDKPDQIRIGFQAVPNGEIIVKQSKWIEDELGVEVVWTQFDSGRDVNTAIASGSIDIGLVGSTPAANGISSGLPYKVFYIYDVIGDNEALAVKSDAGIATVADLEGKTVGTPFGSTTHYSLLQALKAANVDPSDVDIVDLQPPDLLAAWTRGDLDAAYIWQPTLAKVVDDGGEIIVTSRELAEDGIITADVAVVANDFSSKYPQTVIDYLKLEDRAIKQAHDDADKSAGQIATEFEIPEADAKSQLGELVLLSAADQTGADYLGTEAAQGHFATVLKETADFLVEQGVIESAPDLSAFEAGIDTTWLEQAAK